MAEGVEQRVVLGHSASQTAREKAQRFPPVLVMAHPSMVYLAENLVSRVHELEMKVKSRCLLPAADDGRSD